MLLNAASILWAGNMILGRFLKDYIGPWSIMSVRLLVGGIIFIALLKMNGQLKDIRQITDWRLLIVMVLAGVVGYQALLYYGLHWTTSVNTSLISALIPLVTAFFAAIYLKEKLDFHHWIAACFSILGLFIVLGHGDLLNLYNMNFNIGDLLIFISVFFWAVYSVIGKKIMNRMSPFVVTAMGVILAMVIVFPFGIIEINYIQQAVWNEKVVASLIFISIGPTVLSFLFWNKGVQLIGPSRASLFLNTVPVYTIILSAFFQEDKLHLYHLLGLALIIGGSIYASVRYKPEISKQVEETN